MTSAIEKHQPPTSLSQMSVSELTQTAKMLDAFQSNIESMSGICATMRGLVFHQVKEKLAHGQFGPWLKKHFDKTRKTAAEDMRIARGFLRSNPELPHFETLARALAEKSREPSIDRNHPMVRQVAMWVDGRPRVQLLLEFPSEKGGGAGRSKGSSKNVNDPAEESTDIWLPLIEKLEREGLNEKSWKHLPKKHLHRLIETLTDLRKSMKGAH